MDLLWAACGDAADGDDKACDDASMAPRPLHPDPAPATARLFLALWPTPALRHALAAHARLWRWPRGAARVDPAKRHITLHFLGAVPRAQLPGLAQALALPCPTAELRLDTPALWHGGLAVLLAREIPAALQDFHHALGQAIAGTGLPVERRPWHPHVTLARRAEGAQPPVRCKPLVWPVEPGGPEDGCGYVLVESVPGPGGGYRILARYPITAGGAAG